MCSHGAGKTNVAMLTILRTIENFQQRPHSIEKFQNRVYCPVESTCAEQMREFQDALHQCMGLLLTS